MFKKRKSEKPLALFYAGDVHGSRVCWKKFVNAGAHYPAQALVMGGDLTGKALIPIVEHPDGSYTAEVRGEERTVRTDEELDQIRDAIATNGMYHVIVDEDQAQRLHDDEMTRAAVFEKALLDELRVWVNFADERLDGTESVAYVIPGNDDPWSIDEILATGSSVDMCDEAVRQVGPGTRCSSFAISNRTPWKTPRELDEDEIYDRLKRLTDQLQQPDRAIFNIHVPPYRQRPGHRVRGR